MRWIEATLDIEEIAGPASAVFVDRRYEESRGRFCFRRRWCGVTFHEGFLSDIVGKPAVVNDKAIGKVADFVVTQPHEVFPKVDSLVVKTKKGTLLAPAEALVDVDGRKLVRINDIELAKTGNTLRVVAADIGVSGLLRRLGGSRLTKPVLDRIPRSLISWNDVAPIENLTPSDVRLSVSQKKLPRLHPSDLAEIISDLSTNDAASVIRHLDDETAADAFEHLEPERQQAIIEEVGAERAADIIEEMDADDAADVLADLPDEQRTQVLAAMEPETA